MNRQLTKIEQDISRRSIRRLTEEIEDAKCEIADAELKINLILDYSYKKAKKEQTTRLDEWTNKVKSNQEIINTLNDQLTNGVPEKVKQEPEKEVTDDNN